MTPLEEAKAWAKDRSNITGVWLGYKYSDGQRTDTVAIVFSVRRKFNKAEIPDEDMIPPYFGDTETYVTDVVEADFQAFNLTERRRPCPGGYSVGHYNITAGTLGIYVKKGSSDELYALSNNHVLANSNNSKIGDNILQPGPHDGGRVPADVFGTLDKFATINFGSLIPGKDKKQNGVSGFLARMWWATFKGIGNGGAWLVRCPYRLVVGVKNVSQPNPNLVDAALCKLTNQEDALNEIYNIGTVDGVTDLELGDAVQKSGRTTGHTVGMVEGVGATISVNFGGTNVAQFQDQVIIRGSSGEFSAPGDSGSAIITMDNKAGGLLFAGGGGITIANKFTNVQALLGIRV